MKLYVADDVKTVWPFKNFLGPYILIYKGIQVPQNRGSVLPKTSPEVWSFYTLIFMLDQFSYFLASC